MSLMALGAFLTVVGGVDLLRANREAVDLRRQGLLLGLAAVGIVLFLGWAGDWTGFGGFVRVLALGVGMGLGVAAWMVGSAAALAPTTLDPGRWRALALGGLAGGAVISVLGVGALEPWVQWPRAIIGTVLGRWPAADVVVSVGVVLTQITTASILLKLVPGPGRAVATNGVGSGVDSGVDSAVVGSPGGTAYDEGRLLGPTERLILVGLGHIGQLIAAAVVLAALTLMRLPELQARARVGVPAAPLITQIALSWLIALGGVALIFLA